MNASFSCHDDEPSAFARFTDRAGEFYQAAEERVPVLGVPVEGHRVLAEPVPYNRPAVILLDSGYLDSPGT